MEIYPKGKVNFLIGSPEEKVRQNAETLWLERKIKGQEVAKAVLVFAVSSWGRMTIKGRETG